MGLHMEETKTEEPSSILWKTDGITSYLAYSIFDLFDNTTRLDLFCIVLCIYEPHLNLHKAKDDNVMSVIAFTLPVLWRGALCCALPVRQLPSSFRQPHCVHSPPGSLHPTHITSSQSSPSFSPSVTPSTFHSRLKTHLFHKSFPP